MRIFGGCARGRTIAVPKGVNLRPSTDRLRLALFNAVGALVPEGRFLDLFCGSGAVGLEALSRGASQVVFVDSQKRCLDTVRASLQAFGFAPAAWELLCMDYRLALQRLKGSPPFRMVFLDPPYDAGLGPSTLALLATSGLLEPNSKTRVLFEHAGRDASPETPGLILHKRYDHGASSLSVYRLLETFDAH